MSQRINHTDTEKLPITILDGEIDTTLDIGLIGRNTKGFGEQLNENFLHLLENFAAPTPPTRPIEGELWFDNANNILMQYTTTNTWKPVSGTKTEPRDPVTGAGEIAGDIWVNTASLQIFIYLNSEWIPLISADTSTRWVSKTRRDTVGVLHKTLEAVVNNRTVAVFSGDTVSWAPNSTGSFTEYLADGAVMAVAYPTIRLGMNLINRKNIPDVTVSNAVPATGTYTQVGDFWINPDNKNIFIYTIQGWKRTTGSVRIEEQPPAAGTPGELGDFWVDTQGKQLYFFNSLNGEWASILINTIFSTESPGAENIVAEGNYWVNTQTEQLFVYTGTEWLNLSPMTKSTGIRAVVRLDTSSASHEVLECYVDDKIVMVISSDDTMWEPADSETVDDGIQYNTKFPEIHPGVNILGYLLASLVAGDIVATEAQALAGVANDVVMTPLRTRQYVDSVIGALIPDPEEPTEENVPVQAGSFLNYRSSSYLGYQYPPPVSTYKKLLEVELEGDNGNGVKIELQVLWSNWIFSEANEDPPSFQFQIKKAPAGTAESSAPVIASGTIKHIEGASTAPYEISDSQTFRTRQDSITTLMIPQQNSTSPAGKAKYILEVRASGGGGASYIYYSWMTVNHMNFAVTYDLADFISDYNS